MSRTEQIALDLLSLIGPMTGRRLHAAIRDLLPWGPRLFFSASAFYAVMARLKGKGLADFSDEVKVCGAVMGGGKTTLRERTFWATAPDTEIHNQT